MGDAKRRKLSDSSYGKIYRVTESITHIIGMPNDLLIGELTDIKANIRAVNFYSTPLSAIKEIIRTAKNNKLDRYVVLDNKATDRFALSTIQCATDFIAKCINEKHLHPCAAQEFADILTQYDNPNNIKLFFILRDEEEDCESLFKELFESTGLKMLVLLTVRNLN